MKSAILDREIGNVEGERKLLHGGVRRFPSSFKRQLEERNGDSQEAKRVYELGLRHCPKCIPLWLSLSSQEERTNCLSEARKVLNMGREKKHAKSPELWLGAIQAETRNGNKNEGERLLAMALRECPKNGTLCAASIEMAPRSKQESISKDAFKNCDKDSYILAAVAKMFWRDGKVERARDCLYRAVILAPDVGDFWAFYYKFEIENGTDEKQKDVMERCVAAGPKNGEKWQAVSKALENSHLPPEFILKKVALAL